VVRPGDMILVHMLEPQMVGSYFDRGRWPLHITLMPWFSSPTERRRELEAALKLLAQATPPASLIIGEPALFGPNKDIPVQLVAEAGKLRPLHQGLLDLLKLLQLPLTAGHSFIGPEYTPHVSQYEDRRTEPGQRVEASDFYLVELQRNNTCQITARYELKGQGDA
jgi:2'-5' RNA ligase